MSAIDLERELRRFDRDCPVEGAVTPPGSWYVTPEFLEREREQVLRRTWQVVGRTEQVREPGAFFTGELFGEPWVVVRGADSVVRGLSNVCRHHAAIVASGEGRVECLECPYHGWRYDLDGKLASAPRLGAVEGFDREDFELPSFDVATIGPLVLLRLAEGGFGAETFGPVVSRLAQTKWDDLRFVVRRRYEVGCNWKVYVDNYLDGGYHVPVLHRGLAGQLDLAAYETELFDRSSIQSCPGARETGLSEGDFAERVGDRALYAWLYPNAMINRYGPWLDVNHVLPLGHDRCEVVFDYYLAPEAEGLGAEFVEKSLDASDAVQNEDRFICEAVQCGLGSRHYEVGRYSVVEKAMHHFHRMLAADLAR